MVSYFYHLGAGDDCLVEEREAVPEHPSFVGLSRRFDRIGGHLAHAEGRLGARRMQPTPAGAALGVARDLRAATQAAIRGGDDWPECWSITSPRG